MESVCHLRGRHQGPGPQRRNEGLRRGVDWHGAEKYKCNKTHLQNECRVHNI